MNPNFETFVEHLKRTVIKMMEERDTLYQDAQTATASDFWAPWAGTYRYLLDLSPENLKNIRYHTWLVSGRVPGHGLWGDLESDEYTDEEAREIGYSQVTEGVPDKYLLSEPPEAQVFGPLGKKYRGRVISPRVVLSQSWISNLYHVGALQALEAASERQIVVEVGGGYGAVALGLSQILKSKATYIDIDLPELLFIAGVYLALTSPDQSIYVYDSDTFTPEFIANEIREYDYVLVPNFALKKLEPIYDIGLMINTNSLQEMTENQVKEYVEFGADRISGYLYSYNAERHYMNAELDSLSAVLTKYFNLYPDPSYYDKRFKNVTRWHDTRRHYFGVPKDSGRTIPETTIVGLPGNPLWRRVSRIVMNMVSPIVPGIVRRFIRTAIQEDRTFLAG